MLKWRKLMVAGLASMVLAACGKSAESSAQASNDQNKETSSSIETVTEEAGIENLDAATEAELGKENIEDIDWEKVQLTKRQFREYIESLPDTYTDSADEEETLSVVSANMINDKTIEIVINNTDTSGFAELSNTFFAWILDSLNRQLYLHSDYSDGESHPTILIKDVKGTVISESDKFLETDEPTEESTGSTASNSAGSRTNPIPLGDTATISVSIYESSSSFKSVPGKLELGISNVMSGEEAYNFLLAENQFNEPAPEGYQWIVFDVNAQLIEGSEDYAYTPSPRATTISASGTQSPDGHHASLNNSFGYQDMYNGGSASEKMATLAPAEEDYLLQFEEGFDTKIFFSVK